MVSPWASMVSFEAYLIVISELEPTAINFPSLIAKASALLKLLSIKYKQFRPHYETILLESCIEAQKLGYNEVSVLELGVAGGNGLIALEKYKKTSK